MTVITEKTVPNVSVGADTEQPSQKCTANIITTEDENFKSFEEIQRKMIRMMDPSYLKTVSMTELYDTVYKSKPPLIDGLLYPGTYIFAGAPKLGKSFFDGAVGISHQHGNAAMELYHPKRNGVISRP